MNRLTLARFGHRATDGHRFGCADCHAHEGKPHCHENGGDEHDHTRAEKDEVLTRDREPRVVERKIGEVKADEVKRG